MKHGSRGPVADARREPDREREGPRKGHGPAEEQGPPARAGLEVRRHEDRQRGRVEQQDAARLPEVRRRDGELRALRVSPGWEKGDAFSPFSRLLISSHVVTQFPLIVLDESSSLVEFSKSGPLP